MGAKRHSRILIIEDNALNLKYFRDALAYHGFATLEDSSGTGAVSLAKSHPQAILLNLQLPEVSGLDLVKTLKSDPETAHIPIIATSAIDLGEVEHAARSAGCTHFMVKPFGIQTLVETVQECLQQSVKAS
ncbi:MAG: response regulator [Holosporales bacterium]